MVKPADMTYGQYLTLDPLLSAQHPISDHHDELLFIIIHQTKELWLKQTIHELKLARDLIRADKLIEVHKNLSRVSRIQAVMTLSWDVLSTLTPTDYLTFRGVLGTSSGFQSAQFREVEFLLGLKEAARISPATPRARRNMRRWPMRWTRPSLWDEANMALARGGFALPPARWSGTGAGLIGPIRRSRRPGRKSTGTPSDHWRFYQFAEKLVDIDDAFAVWRHKHVVTVERVIGFKQGTGGTPGVKYLASTLAKRAFPELWSLRTTL